MTAGEQQAAAEQGGKGTRRQRDQQRLAAGLPQLRRGQRRQQAGIETGHQDCQLGGQEDGEPGAERHGIHQHGPRLMAIRSQTGAMTADPAGWCGLQLVLQQEQSGGQDQLHQRQAAGGGKVKIKAQRLIDGHLQRGGPGSAPQRQHSGEAGEAEHEDEAGKPRQYAAKERPLQQPENMGRAHAQLTGETPARFGDALYALQHEARRQRHVEEDVGQQYAEQAVQVIAGIQPQAAQQLRQPTLFAVNRHYAEDGNDDRQHQGEPKQLEQQASTDEAAPRQRSCHRNGYT